MLSRYRTKNLIKDVNRKLHSAGFALTSDPSGAIDEGRRELISKIDPPENNRKAFIENALYDQIQKYSIPSDIQYDDIVDIKMLSSRYNLDTLEHPIEHVYQRRFDQKRQNAKNVFTINYENGIKYMQLNHPRGLASCQHRLINDASSLTQQGNWNVGGNVVNVSVDRLNYITGRGSLKFDINSSSNEGFLECFNNGQMNSDGQNMPVNIEEYWQIGSIFTWLYLSDIKIVKSVELRFGSSPTDYYSFTVNAPHDGNELLADWNLLAFPLQGLNQVGFPNLTSISYLRIGFSTTGASMTGCNVDNIVARKGVVYQVLYNSALMFVDADTQVYKQFTDRQSDLIVAEEDTYQLLMLEVTKAVMQEAYDNNNKSNDDISKIDNQLQQKYLQYKKLHKSDEIVPMDSLYVFGNMYDGYTDDPQISNFFDQGGTDVWGGEQHT